MSDLITTRIFTDGEKGITAAKLNDIVAGSTIQTDFVATKPVASTMDPADNLLVLKTSGQYAKSTFQTIVDSVNTQLPSSDSEIWSVRLRSFSSVGNPNFEVDQRNAGSNLTNPTNGLFAQDRWSIVNFSSFLINSSQLTAYVVLPGTSFAISQKFLRILLTGQRVSLGATDILGLSQKIEGPLWRELSSDVTSCSLLVRTSVAGLKFSLSIRDGGTTVSLLKLCTVPSANVWTLIPLPNLPIPVGGTFNSAVGTAGYYIYITLAAGANQIAPAADTWQNGNFYGAPGMSNFAASPVNSFFDIAFCQHEPGPVCSTLMNKPFTQNYDECLRYFQKTWDYATAVGAASINGVRTWICYNAGSVGFGPASFFKPMAVAPTVNLFNHATGVANSIRDGFGVNHLGAAAAGVNSTGFYSVSYTTATTGICEIYGHYKADTGW
jgi:hypothetical protein